MIKKLVIGTLLAASTVAYANDFTDATYLVELTQGSILSEKAYSLRQGGYESATGDNITFDKWYKSKWIDTRVTFMTQVFGEPKQSLGILWGFSTGEKALKYTIAPSIKLGAVYAFNPTKNSSLNIKGSYIFGGKLKEKSCTADYGDIGGVQEVNCRLAASTLAPADTLQYMLNERPRDYKTIAVQYTWNF